MPGRTTTSLCCTPPIDRRSIVRLADVLKTMHGEYALLWLDGGMEYHEIWRLLSLNAHVSSKLSRVWITLVVQCRWCRKWYTATCVYLRYAASTDRMEVSHSLFVCFPCGCSLVKLASYGSLVLQPRFAVQFSCRYLLSQVGFLCVCTDAIGVPAMPRITSDVFLARVTPRFRARCSINKNVRRFHRPFAGRQVSSCLSVTKL
jgi:hypothetical protein